MICEGISKTSRVSEILVRQRGHSSTEKLPAVPIRAPMSRLMLAAALGAAAAAPATRGASHRRRLGEDDDGLTEIDLSKIEGSKEHVRRILTHYDELLASGECIYGEFTNEVTSANGVTQHRGWRGNTFVTNGRTNPPNLPESQLGRPGRPRHRRTGPLTRLAAESMMGAFTARGGWVGKSTKPYDPNVKVMRIRISF